jgi:hypothetical protein
LETMPGCVGSGVSTPLPAVVVVEGWVVVTGMVVVALLRTPTQTLTSDNMPEQSERTVGFQRTKSSRVIF